jgi:hypothetical protein
VRALLLLPLLLAACAAPAPVPQPPLSYPPSAAARVVRLALEEWRDWGEVVQDYAAPAPSADAESRPMNFPRVLAYWRAVPEDFDAVADNRRIYAAVLAGQRVEPALWAEPHWSAAFISWVFRSAGVDSPEFPPSATHAFYIDGLLALAARHPAQAPFLPHGPGEHVARPGDLVCLDRSRTPLRDWRDRLAETGRARPMHCDIVVRGARETGLRTVPGAVEAVGGNVRDAVALTRYPADAEGRVLPAPPGRPPIVLVLESRLGRLPPWGP